MYEEQATQVTEFADKISELRACLKVDDLKKEVSSLEGSMSAANFWDDRDEAQRVTQRLSLLKGLIAAPDAIAQEVEDAQILIELAQGEEDTSLESEIITNIEELSAKLQDLEITSLFSDPRDHKEAILSIHPGAGGTESCDWADMLYRMILRYCERQGFNVEIIDQQPGDEAGLKSATIKATGPFAYGKLKAEAGVHRLVRISPFDSAARRHTSFAAIEVLTPIDDNIEIDVPEDELKMDVFRSSGKGGQKVNKTSSAVRLTHLPTGLVVACQIERSQHRNRATALELLKAKLYDIELKKVEAELADQREDQKDVAWGSQIRSYVLHPYQMVKDHRTNIETGNVEKVLDGDLNHFIEGYLKWKLGLSTPAKEESKKS